VNHTHHPGGHTHPQTFDEIIARGFRLEELQALDKAQEELARDRPAPRAARLPRTTALVAVATREDQATLSSTWRTAFMDAIEVLVEEGKYLALIQDHMDMSHNMHGSMTLTGFYRFLAWHRRYLVEFEREVQRVDAVLRPAATDRLGVPYWRWKDPFPAWLAGFLPARDPVTGMPPPPRKNAPPPDKANAADVNTIVNGFASQSTGIPGENDYTKFTFGLEGWGRRPDGNRLPAHNHGHAWIGGIMNNPSTSPTDPMFWLHHAEIDRLWHIWRQTHPTPGPPLTGANRIMDPWAEEYNDLLDIAALGYAYDSMSL
jgi:tyrosinase